MFFSISSRAHLEVKWANVHKGNSFFYQTAHSNPHYNLILVIDGPVYIEVNEEQLTLQSGEFLLLAPWQSHQGWRSIDEHAGFFWIQFTSDPVLEIIDNAVNPEEDMNLLLPKLSDLRISSDYQTRILIPQRNQTQARFEIMVMFEKLLREMERPQGFFRVRMSILLWTIIERLADETLRLNNVESTLPSSFLTYRRIINVLEESCFEDRTKAQYERMLNLTYEYMSNVFKKYSGLTITTYIQLLRMQRAQDLLRHTSKSIQIVAREVGYEDPYYFSKLFKKTVGVTATQFRQQPS